MRSARILPALLVSLVLSACAAPQVRPQGSIRKVVVVAGSRVEVLPSGSFRQDLIGESNPRTVIARQTESVLATRGFDVVATRQSQAPVPLTDEVTSFIQQNKAEAGVVVILDWLDTSGAAVLGRVDVVLRLGVVDPEGQVLWTDTVRSQPIVSVYQSQSDWNSFLRRAVVDAVQLVP
ncbi:MULTISPECIES: hypothetical protein [Corallococcus]|uniref:hypothetical protein n=1 Tax=Corallococcus TaxID=83461 RepID=UPI001180CE3A|nr:MULTISPECIES: hypothetical protein [Corallococcus]NBD14003.1 hypothetical protein [Corallococcus silvisoli]TSC26804.1 hypothetical protein FOF48_22340 [Corallococcus sp. Z5C101001]